MLFTSLYVLRFKRLACPIHSDTLNIILSNNEEDIAMYMYVLEKLQEKKRKMKRILQHE